jgi:UDP-2-acetamido-3-amino-2,3-dideoxy-glucuronate N-acetyltransferase
VLAVVGLGNWGKNLVRNFAELGALSAICDTDPTTLDRFRSARPDAKAYSHLDQVLADPDVRAVALAIPGTAHYRAALACLRASKHLFVEKPITLGVPQARELNDLARRAGLVLMAGHILEYHPAVLALEHLIRRGDLGPLRYLYSHRLALGRVEPGQDALWSLAPHDVSVLLRLAGEMPQTVRAAGHAALSPGLADTALAWLAFPGELRGHIFVSWLHPFKERRVLAVGDDAMAVFDDLADQALTRFPYRVLRGADPPVLEPGAPEPISLPDAEPLRAECAHFLECIEHGKEPVTGGESALRVTRVLAACRQSLERDGEAVAVGGVGEEQS